MIFNKSISIILSAALFMLLMMLVSIITLTFFNGGQIPFIGLFFVVVFYFIARMFYSYLRNDELYKNNRKYSSDLAGESYITKGERDTKKIFVVVWVIVILLLSVLSLILYSLNNSMI